MEKQLEPHQQRVVDEQKELQTKINALQSFIYTNEIFEQLLIDERDDLISQLHYMTGYNSILNSRINRF